MSKLGQFTTCGLVAFGLASTSNVIAGKHSDDDANFCMDVAIAPFHMETDDACTVMDYLEGDLQDMFYPFTEEEHLFNCDYFGPWTPYKLKNGTVFKVPSAATGMISGEINGLAFEADLYTASLTNWYQDSCADPDDPTTCTFQLAQPILGMDKPLPRVTEVAVIDGTITTPNGKIVPVLMANRSAGLYHAEDTNVETLEIGASVTHSILGLTTYDVEDDDEVELRVMDGTADLLQQGHIFSPHTIEDDPGAAVIKGSICSKDLYKKLSGRSNRGRDDD